MIGKNVNYGGHNKGHIGDSYTYNIRSELDELPSLFLRIQSIMNQADITAEEREKANDYLAFIKEESMKTLIPQLCWGE